MFIRIITRVLALAALLCGAVAHFVPADPDPRVKGPHDLAVLGAWFFGILLVIFLFKMLEFATIGEAFGLGWRGRHRHDPYD